MYVRLTAFWHTYTHQTWDVVRVIKYIIYYQLHDACYPSGSKLNLYKKRKNRQSEHAHDYLSIIGSSS